MTDVLTQTPPTTSARSFASSRGDARFRAVVAAASALILVLIAAIVIFLTLRAIPAVTEMGFGFVTERQWFPDAQPPEFGIAALVFGTLVSSFLALVIAVPVALGTSLFIVELAPPRLGRVVGYLVDALAAVPSVVYGLWGVIFLVPHLTGLQRTLDGWIGFIPPFHSRSDTYGRSLFAAAVVLAIMILPIIAALSREVFQQVPRAHREAALALGATRWEMIRLAVLPYGRSGIIGASMLGLGRALGETIAVALVLASAFDINIHLFEPGGNTIAANIATKFGEAGSNGREALIASGLVLLAITFLVNVIARLVIKRGRFNKAKKR